VPPLPALKVGVVLCHPDGRTTTLSGNAGSDVRPRRLAKILRDTQLTLEELRG
jgi:predicted RNA binding protein YcfA (HicA-like mRNA interferase family)